MLRIFLLTIFLTGFLYGITPADEVLFSDDFSDAKLTGWDIVDFADLDPAKGPSDWVEDDGVLHQNEDTEGVGGALAGKVEGAPDDDPRVGTHAIAGEKEWMNYTFSADLFYRDDDFAGILFRYQDEDNYYRFQLEEDDDEYHIAKMVKGNLTFLITDAPLPELFNQNEWVTMAADARGNTLEFFYKDELIETLTDSDLDRGAIGLMTSSSPVDFDNVRVEGEPLAVKAGEKLATLWGQLKTD